MASTRSGQEVTLYGAAGQPFRGYVCGPQNAPRGVLLIHEWWGLKDHNRALAEQFAELGYRALVADLYDGRVTDDAQQAGEWMRSLDQGEVDGKLRAALRYLQAPGRRVATYGCSFGGRQALEASLLDLHAVAATVMLYSRMETDARRLRALNGPVLAIYAEGERAWPEKMHAFERAMAEAGKVTESHSYAADHGFTNPTSPRYDREADQAAWSVTLAFLARYL